MMNYPPSPPSTPTESSNLPTPSQSLRPSKSTSIKENVQVMVRCRPKSKKELDEEPCWLIDTRQGTVQYAKLTSTVRSFNFDNVVMGEGNEQVYKAGIQNLVRSTMMGYNDNGTEKEPGVIPRAVEEVFSYIEEDTSGREYLLRVSYMEIYNERIKDLLTTEDKNPDIVEDKKKGIYVRHLTEEMVKTPKEVMRCIKLGEGNRHISATDYNDRSSRSHTIFQLVIESRPKTVQSKTNLVRISQLNLIDLAGSEKVASDMERRKEGAFINKSLLTLGNVISKLTSDEPALHIPFRNSKLTRILQAALSGNARISVICTINPTLASKDESMNTLKFAQRAKLVKTDAKMTKIGEHSQLQNCLRTIAELQTQMQEKTDFETETRKRLENLLGLILTSSKGTIKDDEWASLCLSADFSNPTSVEEMLARCEEGFSAKIEAHNREVQRMTETVDQLQNKIRVMENIILQKTEIVIKRETQIESLTGKNREGAQHLIEAFGHSMSRAIETLLYGTQEDEEMNKAKEIIRQFMMQKVSMSDDQASRQWQEAYETIQRELEQLEQEKKKLEQSTEQLLQEKEIVEQLQQEHEQLKQDNEELQQKHEKTREGYEELKKINDQLQQDNEKLYQKMLQLYQETEQQKHSNFISIQEAISFILPAHSLYHPIREQQDLSYPELVEEVEEDCITCHSQENSFWEEHNENTESEVEEDLVKEYEPYSQSIQQYPFYVPKFIWIAILIYLLGKL
ncbi:hypothetical protein G6F16_010117 [Rhizopus arrhizus]|nr:hypothetical protein G6F17_010119 [Rhizopus arrhizus]KAG0865576.1 hypothetical protein G6F16_010117 [Rhizopus arrhizus]KAG0890178.1 hypothetical protein G6F15_000022 [Rhizopus arrhizus]KAG0915517.1 hypothetical protein G6F33_003258 [Rhizopus arrhizus]KAG1107928.1 hypothetical protein G6F40_009665 [Rhizopus arrhizus]